MVRQPICPTTHWSENPLIRRPIGPKVSLVRKSLVRKSVSLVRRLAHWSENPLVRKSVIGPKKCYWSEKVLLVRKSVIGPKIAGSKGMGIFSRAVDDHVITSTIIAMYN